ncbi:G-type lectin S-receptor-like serine/threonine-protein kinase SRK [Entomortierella lignicola]|nr:G-type lectin S-receptor-like serine/threonine-protein kinase SRK [Entomortierella lignicola]
MGPPPPMGQMMPGFGFNQQGLDPHQMYLHQMMQHGRGPPMSQFPPGPSQQSRPPSQNNALASLLQSLNQPVVVSPTNTSVPTFSAASQQLNQPVSQSHTPPSQVDLQASTESLKLALFGPPKPEVSTAQQKTDDLKMALFGGSRPDLAQPQPSPKKEEVNLLAMLQKSSNASSPVPQSHADGSLEGIAEMKGGETRRESTTRSPASKDNTPQSSSKAKFTYVNPFHSFTSSASAAVSAPVATTSSTGPGFNASPSHSRTSTPIAGPQDGPLSGPSSKRSSFSTPVPRRETASHLEPDTSSHPRDDQKRYQLDQLLPPHSAWNHRVQKLAKGSSSRPDSGITTYDTGLDNSDAIFSEDLETIPITLIATDVEYNHGKMVAVSKGYISYAAKGGKIRVIQQSHGHRTLLRGHTDQIIDMCFSSANSQDSTVKQLLASIGRDSKLVIWDLSGSNVDSTDIVHSKYLELLGEPQSDQPRYSRIAWSPVNPSQLALVNNDDHSVIIVNIHNLVKSQVGESPIVSEAQIWPHSVVIQAHDQAINEISFSRDGTVLITASEDGSVKFWALNTTTQEPALLNEFVPHGGLGVTNAMFVDQPDAAMSRCIVTACRRGTELSLWHVGGSGPLDQLVFKEPPSSTRRASVGKAALRLQEMRMFNFMGYDYETSSLVLANSARLSLFGLKIKVTSTSEGELISNDLDQSAYIKAFVAADEAPCTATFDFMIEYPMPQPVVSFVVTPDSSPEYNGFSVYCIQAKAVQQYIIKGLEPHDKHKCQMFVSAPPSVKPAEPKAKTNSKASTPKSSNSPSIKVDDNVDPLSTLKIEKSTPDLNPAVSSVTHETQDKEPEKSIKLHGPVINGAIAKLKEKKRNSIADSQPQAESSDKKEQTKNSASGRTGRKASQDLSTNITHQDNNRKGQNLTADIKLATETARTSGRNGRQSSNRHQDTSETSSNLDQVSPTGNITVSVGDIHSMLQAMEDRIASRFEKKLSMELEQQYRKMDQEQISRQEAVLKMVSQTLSKNTEQLLVQTVNKEIQNSVVPSLNKIIGNAVERQLSRTINDATLKALPSAVESAVNENVGRILGSPAFIANLTEQVASTIKPSIEGCFKDSFSSVLIPSYQKATQAMFQQMHGAFNSGIEELISSSGKGNESVEQIASYASKINSTVENLALTLNQIVQGGSEQMSSIHHPHLDQQRKSIAAMELQKTLQGESYTGTSSFGTRRSSQLASPVESKQTAAINELVAYGDFEGAFTQALSTNEPNTVFQICSKVSPRAVFQQTSTNPSGTLSQPVLLALTHHLANEQLGQNLGIKLTWLQEIVMRLNPKDPYIGDHMTRILPNVKRRLEETSAELMSSGEASPHLHMLQMLLRYVNNLIS